MEPQLNTQSKPNISVTTCKPRNCIGIAFSGVTEHRMNGN